MIAKKEKIRDLVFIVVCFVILLWVVEGVNFFLGHRLCGWGILPRTIAGLTGIPLAPFLHAGVMHLLLNTAPLLVLGTLIILHGKALFFKTTVLIILAGGAALWLIGRPSYHVGASGLIFGYFGFLVSRGIIKKSLSSIAISLLTVFSYGGLLWGLLPASSHVSWEGHLCGFVAGIVAAKAEKNEKA